MSGADLIALSPWLVVAATAIVVMLAIAARRGHRLAAGLTLAGLLLALAALPLAATAAPRGVTPLLIVDGYALFYTGLLLLATAVVAVLAYHYLVGRQGYPEEFYVLLLLAVLGAAVLTASTHLLSFFLGLELLSVSLYSLIAYLRTRQRSLEAGLKYLVLSSVSTAFLLFGMALVYAEQGTLAFDQLIGGPAITQAPWTMPVLAGMAMITVAVGFKLSLVPFHLWSPDVYEGAPAPVSAFVATVSKGGVFALLLRLFGTVDGTRDGALYVAVALMAAASMLGGSLLALRQDNIKRVLAYSSIAHLGYLLVPLLAGGEQALEAGTFYLVAYLVTTLAAFGVVTVLSGPRRDAGPVEDYQGLFWRRPWLGGLLAVALFSLAGLPLTAGFVAKFYLVGAGAGAGMWWLLGALVLSSAIAIYYYLRIIVAMYSPLPEDTPAGARPHPAGSLAAGLVLVLLALSLVGLGIYPTPLLQAIQSVMAGLF